MSTWRKILCKKTDLQLIGTLNGGQSFRWKLNNETNEWTGVFEGIVWQLSQDDDYLRYKVLGTLQNNNLLVDVKEEPIKVKEEDDKYENILRKYFRLDVCLEKLYSDWSASDPIFEKAAKQFYGIRILAQDPVENLFSFICSQNNHISRISSMIDKLCYTYGDKICEVDNVPFYSFPTVDKLAPANVEQQLRLLGFGYRAKFIRNSALKIQDWGGCDWFDKLMKKSYMEAKAELIQLPGVGAKVADCICLMSLNHLEAVPVDTHVYQIASENYLKHLKGLKSVTTRVYDEIGDHFRNLYGPLAGWAHTVLFCADLKKFEINGVKRISDVSKLPKAAKKKKK